MAAYYLMAAEGVWRRLRRRLPGVLAWAAFVGLMLAPFAAQVGVWQAAAVTV